MDDGPGTSELHPHGTRVESPAPVRPWLLHEYTESSFCISVLITAQTTTTPASWSQPGSVSDQPCDCYTNIAHRFGPSSFTSNPTPYSRPEKAEEAGLSPCTPALTWESWRKFLAPERLSSSYCDNFGSEPADRGSLSASLHKICLLGPAQ